MQGLFLHHTGDASDAVEKLTSGVAACRATGATLFTPTQLAWLAAAVSSDFFATQEITDVILREAEARPQSTEICTAARLNGNAHWMAGSFSIARAELERALAMFDPERDADFSVRFAQDIGVAITAYLSLALWPLGEVDRACHFAAWSLRGAQQIDHAGSLAYAHSHCALLEMLRRNKPGVAAHAEAMLNVSHTHEMPMFATYGGFYRAWASPTGQDVHVAEMRAAVASCRERGMGLNLPVFVAALAEAEMQAGEVDVGFVTVGEALATSERFGQRWYDAEAHRIRGEILVKRNPANPAPAEAAFLTAIETAQQQQARSYRLRAALALAKLHQSRSHAADARDVLALAIESFSPTPEFPEIEEAQAMLAALKGAIEK
jgi:predicted ATPase